MPSETKQRAADFGPGILAAGLSAAGQGVAEIAQKQDEIEDVNAKIEANRLAVEHAERARMIGNRVKQTLGEGAEAAAEAGAKELEDATKEILATASLRARIQLQAQLGGKNVAYRDQFLDHGFNEKKTAFEASSQARIDSTLEEAADIDDEAKAQALLGTAGPVIREQARFFGRPQEWVDQREREVASGFFKSRALKFANGPNGSAKAAIEYATTHRAAMTDEDYNAVLSSYNNQALEEVATEEVYGTPTATAATTSTAPDPDTGQSRQLDPVAFFKTFIAPHEGSALVIDSNGAKVKLGVNAAYHPNENIEGMTVERAAQIFTKDYYQESGADKLPPALAAVHTDTYWLNKSQAKRILKESGGDVDKYIQLRSQFLNGLVAKDPAKFAKYQRGWQRRTDELAQYAARQGGSGAAGMPVPTISADTDLSGFKDATMARTDIGLALKTRMIAVAERRRADAVQERNVVQSNAADRLTESALGLGDGFTDVSQLPQDAWFTASPQTRQQFQTLAKNNRENKPLKPEDAAYIEQQEIANPTGFASPKFLDELRKRGVPLATIRSVAARQGQIRGNLMNPKAVDPIADSSLWTIAKPAFEQAGILLDTIEEKQPTKIKGERIADAQRQAKAVGFLRDIMTRWMANNPGKKPTDQDIRGWVGRALLQTKGGQRLYEAPPHEVYHSMPAALRQQLIRRLYGNGPKPPPNQIIQDVVAVYMETIAAVGGSRQIGSR